MISVIWYHARQKGDGVSLPRGLGPAFSPGAIGMQARGALFGIRKSRAELSIHRGLRHSAGLRGGLSLRLGGFSGRISEAGGHTKDS